MQPSEVSKSLQICVKVTSIKQINLSGTKDFTFDKIFNESTSQQEFFRESIKPNLDKALLGYNFCAFAYGQTGSGKTYSMGTNYNKHTKPIEMGFLPNSLTYIFEKIKELQDEVEFLVKISFIEIYNEEIKDLLNIKVYLHNLKKLLIKS